jgi:alcohol dehydrogenase (cytochrome c)
MDCSYGYDLANDSQLYRVPVTRVDNVDESFSTGAYVHFCPGAVGGAEWNSPSYDPKTNLIMVGEVEWCDTVTLLRPRPHILSSTRAACCVAGTSK